MDLTWSSLPAKQLNLPFDKLLDFLPDFEKVPFQYEGKENDRFDTIINCRTNVPINNCSKRYSLIQHHQLITQVDRILEEIEPNVDKSNVTVKVSKNFERLWIECKFPECLYDPGDGNEIELRLHAFNSTDLSIPFEITFGWYREICSNGMIAMERGTSFRHRHTPNLSEESISRIAEDLWNSAFMDTERYSQLLGQPVEAEGEVIQNWIDRTVNSSWGLNMAGRVYNIVRTGYDGTVSYPEGGKVRGIKPTDLEFTPERKVPGSNPAENMYDVVNAASWISSHQPNLKDRIKRMRQLPDLIKRVSESNQLV